MLKHEAEVHVSEPIILVGNPNVGKSALFGALSGRYVEVSNYPGTTVDYSSGWAMIDGIKREIYDSPGADTLSPVSEDEAVTRDLLFNNLKSPVICVIDSKNLQRGFVLLSQLAEFGRRVVISLNMADEAVSAGIKIDEARLAQILGVPVVSTIATERIGIEKLKAAIATASIPRINIEFGQTIEDGIRLLSSTFATYDGASRGVALSFLGGDDGLPQEIRYNLSSDRREYISRVKQQLQLSIAEPLAFVIAKRRNEQAEKYIEQIVTYKGKGGRKLARKLGELSYHPVYGIPILLLALIALYYLVGVFGAQILVGFVEQGVFGRYINPYVIGLFSLVPSSFIRELFTGQFGIITMALTYAFAIIFPIVTTFFIAFGILEDSGYLPRLAFMVDRIFKKIGLNGRAVLPMILGLGCDTMAVLTTRILSTRKEKILVTFLLALAVPCSAQLGVTLGILGSISPLAVLIWLGVVLVVMFLVGYISSKVIPGRSSDFILEIPPLRLPHIKNVIIKTLMRLEWYLKEAVPLFVLGTLILFVLDKIKVLKLLERAFSPVVTGILGLPAISSESFIMGFLRRDYGAAGFKSLFEKGSLDAIGAVVAMTTITLFIPCIANFFIMIKERGLKVTMGMVLFIFPFAIAVGGLLNLVLRGLALW
jgi:ferrous iron transport protein B